MRRTAGQGGHLLAGGTFLLIGVLASACAGPAQPARDAGSGAASAAAAPRRVTVAIMSDPGTLVSGFAGEGGAPGIDALQEMTNAGLANINREGRLRPQLAEAVPSLENGLWKLLPDGRMETTWKLKPAQWHDGARFTSADLEFSSRFWKDDELPVSRDIASDSIEAVTASDPQKVVVIWKKAFIDADTLFTEQRMMPLPRHVLEKPYLEDKRSLVQHSYWTDGFVGTGAYRLRDWERGSHLVLVANDSYVLGRPHIDEIEVRFFRSPESLVSSILAGNIDVTVGRNLSLDQSSAIRDQWRDGQVELSTQNWFGIYPQFVDLNPALIADVRFRKALLHAIDRQGLVDSLLAGLTSVAHSYLSPNDPDYEAVLPSVVQYDYDPRKTAQMVEALGYTRASDGGFRDTAGQPLSVEIRTTGEDDVGVKSTLSVADAWSRAAVHGDPVLIPPARARDREYRANFPGFQMIQQPNGSGDLRFLHGSAARLPPDYAGRNQARYQNPEFDRILDAFYTTVPRPQRTRLLAQAVHHISDQLNVMGLFYNVRPTMISKRMRQVTTGNLLATQAWNVEEWDLQ